MSTYDLYKSEKVKLENDLETKFHQEKYNARDKSLVIDKYQGLISEDLVKIHTKLETTRLTNFLNNWRYNYKIDKNLSEKGAFDKTLKESGSEIDKKTLLLIAEYEVKICFLNKIDKKIDSTGKRMTQSIWMNKNHTSFLQLIEGLIQLGYIQPRVNQGKLELIQECAEFFGLELSEHWKSNLSKSKNERNNNYVPEIFKNLIANWENNN